MNENLDVYSLYVPALNGNGVELRNLRGAVSLVVNVASECGFTPQYAGLQALHSELVERGFTVLAFPSNEFGAQEPGSPEQIRKFCTERYGVDFPLFAKTGVKPGPNQSPVYATIERALGEVPEWNFAKVLIGRNGRPRAFFASDVSPDDSELRAAIEEALAERL